MDLNLGSDTSFCDSETIILDAEHPGATYTWSTGATSQTLEVLQTGLYELTVSHFCGDLTDAINIEVNPTPVVSFGTDTIFTVTNDLPVTLNPNATGTTYQWSDGSSNATAIAPDFGTYSVTVTNQYGCAGEGSVVVTYKIGVDEISLSDQISLYPNPLQNKLYISLDDLRVEEIRIYSSIGSFISQITNIESTVEVNTQNLSEGIYFVKILTKENELIIKSFSEIK